MIYQTLPMLPSAGIAQLSEKWEPLGVSRPSVTRRSLGRERRTSPRVQELDRSDWTAAKNPLEI